MNMKIRVGSHLFEVEVGDLQTRPIIARVNGEPFEVWPEEEQLVEKTAVSAPTPASHRVTPAAPTAPRHDKVVRAPIPGLIASIAVAPGDTVTAGQPLCQLEAMKMNNIIRAPKAGTITAVLVTAGQHVQHNTPLVEYDS